MSELPTAPGPNYANAADLERAWRPLTQDEKNTADELLDYVSAILRSRVRRLDEWIADGTIDPALVRLATILPVKRVLMNPEAARQRSQTDGPFTRSITVDSAVSTGALYVSDADLAIFLPARRGATVGTARLKAGLA